MTTSEFLYAIQELFPNRKDNSYDELYRLISDLIPKSDELVPTVKYPNWVADRIIRRMLTDRGLDYKITSIEEVYGYEFGSVNHRVTFEGGHTMMIYDKQYWEYVNKFI